MGFAIAVKGEGIQTCTIAFTVYGERTPIGWGLRYGFAGNAIVHYTTRGDTTGN